MNHPVIELHEMERVRRVEGLQHLVYAFGQVDLALKKLRYRKIICAVANVQ